MSATIELTDTHVEYLAIAEARKRSGLRLVLGAYAVPGPWREACKGLFDVKGIPYASVVTANADSDDMAFGMQDADRELREWTGQASAPVAIYNDERPRVSWIDQINLAERLEPQPALVPTAIDERTRMFGLLNEIAGEYGLGWSKRLCIIEASLSSLPPGAEGRAFFEHLALKYGYTETLAARAPAHMATIISTLDAQLASQRAAGSRYLIGAQLSALDIYWATFCAMFAPLPPEQCPMGTAFRDFYTNPHPETQRALSTELLAHRDFVYTEHLRLPIVF